MLNPVITNNLSQIKDICKKHHVKELYVFGSAVRNKMNDNSDVDFLVEFKEDAYPDYATNYFDLLQELSSLVKRSVDLVTILMVKNKLFKDNVEKNKQPVFIA
jgi:predicted nucleotidyltransferase